MGILDELKRLIGNRVKVDEPLSRHTSFGIGGPSKYFLELRNIVELRSVIEFCGKEKLDFFVLGQGTNVLFSDAGFRGVVIRLKGEFEKLSIGGEKVTAGAGVKLGILVEKLTKKGLSGLEFAAGIPGSLGGAIVSNSGTKWGSIGGIIKEIRIFCNGKIKVLKRDEMDFSYRHCDLPNKAIIVEAKLGLKSGRKSDIIKTIRGNLKDRRKNQPLSTLNAGCIFKNPESYEAGRLIENAGLKGIRFGDAEVSRKHGNFIVNRGSAKAKDVYGLIKKIRETVRQKFGIGLELELRIIGEIDEGYTR